MTWRGDLLGSPVNLDDTFREYFGTADLAVVTPAANAVERLPT